MKVIYETTIVDKVCEAIMEANLNKKKIEKIILSPKEMSELKSSFASIKLYKVTSVDEITEQITKSFYFDGVLIEEEA